MDVLDAARKYFETSGTRFPLYKCTQQFCQGCGPVWKNRPLITGYRLLVSATAISFGTVKIYISYRGEITAPKVVEWVYGAFVSLRYVLFDSEKSGRWNLTKALVSIGLVCTNIARGRQCPGSSPQTVHQSVNLHSHSDSASRLIRPHSALFLAQTVVSWPASYMVWRGMKIGILTAVFKGLLRTMVDSYETEPWLRWLVVPYVLLSLTLVAVLCGASAWFGVSLLVGPVIIATLGFLGVEMR